jgi:hypothetical protein
MEEGAQADHTLVWVNGPSKYREACTYVEGDHKPFVETLSVAAAVIVDIPVFGTARRNKTFP